jgi:cellulose synthase/poly-beta-1,6-N-acetylglucosamine synthase-like glycosyltransferase
VDAPGVTVSLNAGLDAATGDVMAITDDDAVPRADWLARMMRHFERDPQVGGVGGRDWVQGEQNGAQTVVGKVRWYGRVIGNHHLGVGESREVDLLKGANMGFRRAALVGIEIEQLRGSGIQTHWEIGLCLAVKRARWRLVYDPGVAVDHYPAQRFDEDQRSGRSLLALQNEVYNQTYVLLRWLPWWRKPSTLLYGLGVGSRKFPGIVVAIERAARGQRVPGAFSASMRGRLAALGALAPGRRSARLPEAPGR